MRSEDVRSMGAQAELKHLFGDRDGLQGSYQALAKLIEDHQRFLVVAHVNPDGDAIGSTLALCHILWSMGKDATPFNVSPVPFNFLYLDGAERFAHTLPQDEHFDVTIMLDCAQKPRVGENFPANGWGDHIAVVDHHLTWDDDFAQVYVRDTEAAAVGEMIYRLGLTLDVPVTLPMAEACYTSVMTDTGGFRYGKTSTLTFQIASHLVAFGVNPWRINSNVYENEPLGRMRLLARVLDTLNVSDCGRLAFIQIGADMLAQTGTDSTMIDGFINYARRIQGVEVATQLRELDKDHYKVSFRSSGAINVAALAESFGGGGHHNAAGCTISGDVADIQRQLSQRLSAML